MFTGIKSMFSKEDSTQAKNPLLKVVPCKNMILICMSEKKAVYIKVLKMLFSQYSTF